MTNKNVKQFDIWQLNLNPSFGSEQAGIRPALILETNATQNKGKTTVIIPLTSKLNKIFAFDVIIKANKETGLKTNSKLKLRQIRVIDKKRLHKKIGEIKSFKLRKKILESLCLMFDVDQFFSV
jgi:mRNA interferase MazF